MDEEQNTNIEPQKTSSSFQGGQRVIQPIPNSGEGITTQQTIGSNQVPDIGSSMPEQQTNVQTSYQPQNISVTPTVVAGGEISSDKTFTPISQTDEFKPRKHWLKLIISGLILIIFIIFGILLVTNKNLQATVFRKKFVGYTYVNSQGNKYSILFYRNSTYQDKSISSTSSVRILTSPVIKPYPTPVTIDVNGRQGNSTSQSQKLLSESSSCSFSTSFNIQGFSVYIPSLKTTANFCTSQSGKGIIYESFFGSDKAVYAIFFQEYSPLFNTLQSAEANTKLAQEMLNNPLNTNDLKTIVASFKPLS